MIVHSCNPYVYTYVRTSVVLLIASLATSSVAMWSTILMHAFNILSSNSSPYG